MIRLMKKFMLLLIFVTCHIAYGQNNTEEVVYLKNGSIIRGVIIEHVLNQSIKIQTKDRNVFVFKYEEIEKITKEPLNNSSLKYSQNKKEFRKGAFFNITEINFALGIGNVEAGGNKIANTANSFGFRTINGIQPKENLSLGIGIGIDKYENGTLMPITLDLRIFNTNKKVSPIFTTNLGYSIGLGDADGGIVLNPQIGIMTPISNSMLFLLSLGYKLQESKATYLAGYNVYTPGVYTPYLKTEQIYLQFVSFNAGITF